MKFQKDKRPITKVIRDKWYPFRIQKIKRGVNNPTKLRRGLKPGSIVILLTGPYRGRRVVFLKQMQHSGLLLITGPFTINGVPLRRVSQRFVIITSTTIDISGVNGIDAVTDAYFKRPKKFDKKSKKAKLPAEKRNTQLNIDKQVWSVVDNEDLMKQYLRSYFTIKPGQPPHAVRF
jgi:large subunit ribosomal protein L6e